MSDASIVAQLRKSGELEEATALARHLLAGSPEDWHLQNAYGWVIHDTLKRAGGLLQRDVISASQAESILDWCVNEYFHLGQIHRPDLLHSLILHWVLKIGRNWPRFLGFARWWDPDNFREEDLQSFFANDGRELPSLARRFAYGIARTVTKVPGSVTPEDIEWGERFLNEALVEAPDDHWLQYYKCKLMLLRGDLSGAREMLLPVVKRQRTTAWAWSLLGETWERDSPEEAIICYQYAITLAQKPLEVLNVRERLANLLIKAARFPEAASHVKAALENRNSAGYRIPQALIRLSESSWYTAQCAVQNPLQPERLAGKAAGLLYGELRCRSGVLDHHNLQKRLSHVAFGPKQGVVLKHSFFREIGGLSVGAVVDIAIDEESMTPIRAVRSVKYELPGFYEVFDGILERVASRDFGFVRTTRGIDVFVPPDLMLNRVSSDGEHVRCRAILSHDKKKGMDKWKSLEVISDLNH